MLAASALDGTRRGLLLGALDLLAALVGLGIAFVFERPVGDAIVDLFPALGSALAHVAAFLVLLIAIQVVIGATVGRVIWAVVRLLARGPLGGLDRVLGVAPGLIRGAVTTTL